MRASDVRARSLMEAFGHDEHVASLRAHRRVTTLPERPAPRVRVIRRIREDHFAGFRLFQLAVESQMRFVARGMADLQVRVDAGEVEHGHRERKREGQGVAEVDERMQVRHGPLAPEPAQQRLRRGAVLGRLQPHLRIGTAPGRDLGELGLRPAAQSLACALVPRLEQAVRLDVRSDGSDDKHAGYQLGEFAPDRGGMTKSASSGCAGDVAVHGHVRQHTRSGGTFDRSNMVSTSEDHFRCPSSCWPLAAMRRRPCARRSSASCAPPSRRVACARSMPLPSSRALAADISLSRGVVVEAYEQLLAEGYLIARRGSATRVATRTTRAGPSARDPTTAAAASL